MKKALIIIAFWTTSICTLSAQQSQPAKAFDFWIGTWDTKMSTAPDWTERKGIDSVLYHLNGTLIEEIFTKEDGQGTNFQRGYLVYLHREKRWRHIIHDAKWGEYSFYGNKDGDKIVLTSLPGDTRPGRRRETFYNITKDSFDYLWEQSRDNGKTWVEGWKVSYKRKK